MNLSEALDAALPEIPRTRLSRKTPPRIDPELIVREDVTDGEPIFSVYQRSTANLLRLKPTQWQLARLFDGVRSYEEIAAAFEAEAGIPLSAEEVRTFAENMDEGGFWYKNPQEKNIAMNARGVTPALMCRTYRSRPGIPTGTLPGSTRKSGNTCSMAGSLSLLSCSSYFRPWSSGQNGVSLARTYRFTSASAIRPSPTWWSSGCFC
jgi:hypothetical protein